MKPTKQLDVTAKQDTSYCVSTTIRDLNIRANNEKVKERVVPFEGTRAEPIAIVGYGPSLNATWKELKNFKHIISCSGATKFLLDKGLDPYKFDFWGHLDVDPRVHKLQLIGEPHPKIEYLMASAVHPDVIDHLLKHKATIKLWHIFAVDGESEQVLPRGEWSITGGSDAGMRCMTVARFLGYKNVHIFGMDGSEGKTGKHASEHPNQGKGHYEAVVNGKTFLTTPSWVSCAQQWLNELDQLADVEYKFYGEGLVQEMAKNYVRRSVKGNLIAFNKPELISPEMRKLNEELHKSNVYYGVGGSKYTQVVIDVVKQMTKTGEPPPSVLDYGAGKGTLAKELPFPIFEYDPAIQGKDEPPRPADFVICTDVLEHIEPETLDAVLDDLKRVVKQTGYFVIHIGPAVKTYADGRNAHLIQEPAEWWQAKLGKHFTVNKAVEKMFGKSIEFHLIVEPLGAKDFTKVGDIKFYTPNETTRWRANTILTKEPVTIEWLKKMKPGEVLYDIGANVGGYSVYAGVRGVKVYSFEPEAENFGILTRNLALNKLEPNAYPMAVTDKSGFDVLHLSQFGAGGSCHSFRDALSFDGKDRKIGIRQGCIGISLDAIKGQLPQPDHIKIDVDGLEYKVIKGALDTLQNVKSLLVEVNPSMQEHLDLIELLKSIGFTYDQKQVDKATRKKGPFKGVAEYVFTRDSSLSAIEKHLIEQIEKAEVISDPYPHFVIEDCFEKYLEWVNSLPSDYVEISKVRPTKGYPTRFVSKDMNGQWRYISQCMTRGAVKDAMCKKFGVTGDFTDETLLIRDKPGYAIGPHSDSSARVLSAIFYLAKDDKKPELGTSLYTPKKKGFVGVDGQHHPEKDFKKLKTIPYKPNTAFVFLKTENSWHGVSKTKDERDVFLYDVRKQETKNDHSREK